ncbi:recombinase family protein [Streptomyces sp. Je 1-79]|uniref:recombinase family protein n=1 Tax=Streptomyces sp. Je 1-79 TaxID=2943847 RepID=UPI0021A5BA89|nr:recombinase family protein [Streptomyces sp. Je 1-79]MCT4356550.1 recombinase family protein [Streptomyces sp. Je 1-79]
MKADAEETRAYAKERKTTRAFLYDRHATTITAALDIRLARCRAYAEQQGWEIAGTWVDLGDHALSDARPQFSALCRAMAATPGPVVCLVDDLDRLNRSAGHRAVMRRRVGSAGGYCATASGGTDRADGLPSPSEGAAGDPFGTLESLQWLQDSRDAREHDRRAHG